ncbi:MAG TPA: hypothetical protein VMS21_14490 [Methylomirabilota bacterium]|nr:hypothetical protein [Methylomirabilota bacterium]
MKRTRLLLALCALGITSLTGCVAIPPLVNVQHEHHGDPKMDSRLKAMEERLERIEQKVDQQQ